MDGGLAHLKFRDEYEHINPALEYILENVLMAPDETESYQVMKELYNSKIAVSCKCNEISFITSNIKNIATGIYCGEKSTCLHGGNYTEHIMENGTKELVLSKHRPAVDLIFECSEACSCASHCINRLVQYGPRNNLIVIDLSEQKQKQLGLATKKKIPKGAFICEYAGEILTRNEALRRYNKNLEENNSMNYIICLNEMPITCREKIAVNDITQIQTFIDPSRKGNIGRYLNHSCEPNCEIFSVRIDCPLPRLGIFAKRMINPFEELCFDYGDNSNAKDETINATKSLAGVPSLGISSVPLSAQSLELPSGRKLCFCGSVKCKKFLPNIKF